MPNSKGATSKRATSKRVLRNNVGDPTSHLAKKLQANRLHEIRRESAMRAATRTRGGGKRKSKSLWKQIKALFTRKRK
jgi:hypothetical protein